MTIVHLFKTCSGKLAFAADSGMWVAVCVAALIMSGCSTNGTSYSNSGQYGGGTTNNIVIPRDYKALLNGSAFEIAIYNGEELFRQKRFVEARHEFSKVREHQNPGSDGYRALTAQMAIAAFYGGDLKTFKRTARQLDTSLGKPTRVSPSYVKVISLYRAITRQNLPVNAPQGLVRLKAQFFTANGADEFSGITDFDERPGSSEPTPTRFWDPKSRLRKNSNNANPFSWWSGPSKSNEN